MDRYAYVNNNPLIYVDPSGHKPKVKTDNLSERILRHEDYSYNYSGIPYPEFIEAAKAYFANLGYTFIGDPNKSIYTNGADLLFRAKDGVTLLAVELKNYSGSINLGNIGRAASGTYSGSIGQLVNTAIRYAKSARNSNLTMESRIILDVYNSGNLQNALFTTAQRVSQGAQNLFNGVFSMNANNNTINIIKNIGGTAAAPTILSTLKSALGPITNFAGNCEIFMPIVIIPLPLLDIPGQTGKT